MVELTVLNTMASSDFVRALDRHLEWGLKLLDLKDLAFGKRIVDLTAAEAARARELIRERGLSVYCFSTQLFEPEVELGEAVFRRDHLGKIDHTLEIARILQPRMIRLLGAQTAQRTAIEDSIAYLNAEHPWALPLYGDGCNVTIDNNLRVTLQRGIPFQYAEITSYLPDGVDSGAVVWEPQNNISTLENKALFTQGIYNEMRYFCDQIQSGKVAVKGSLESAIEVMEVYEAALLSNGARVTLDG